MFDRLSAHLLWMWVILFLSVSLKVEAVEIEDGRKSVASHASYYESSDSSLTVEEALAIKRSGGYTKSSDTRFQFGYSDSEYWIYLPLTNQSESDRIILEIPYPPLDYLDVFVISEGEVNQTLVSGDRYPYEDRSLRTRNHVFEMTIEQGERAEVLMRVRSSSSLLLPMYAYSSSEYIEQMSMSQLWMGLYYGIALGLFLYNLFLYFFIKDNIYIKYLFYVLFNCLFMASLDGLLSPLFSAGLEWQNKRIYVFGFIMAAFLTHFSVHYLEVRKTNPRLSQLLDLTFYLFATLSFAFLFMDIKMVTRIFTTGSGIAAFGVLLVGLYRWRQGYRPAIFFVTGMGTLLMGVLATSLGARDILVDYSMAPKIMKVGTILELLLFSAGLADRINQERTQRLKAEKVSTENEKYAREQEKRLRISEQKRREGLALEVKKRTLDLEKAKNDAERATQSKSQFLAAMSHEIRTPMNGVLGMLELLTHSELKKDQRRIINVIEGSAKSLLQIINDILDFSKIEAGKLDIEYSDTDIASIIESAISSQAITAHNKGLSFRVWIDPGLARVAKTDQVRLRQILSNLISNAIKYTESGHVSVFAEAGSIENTGRQVIKLQVRDTGIGVSEENQKKLFQPFVQAEESTTRRFGGTGLGLVICRRLAELMDAKISMTSVEGKGTSVTFRHAVEVVEASSRPNLPEAMSITLIADNPFMRKIITTYCEKWGVQCIDKTALAEDQQALLGIFQTDSSDAILVSEHLLKVRYDIQRSAAEWVSENRAGKTLLLQDLPEWGGGASGNEVFNLSGNPLLPGDFVRALQEVAGWSVSDDAETEITSKALVPFDRAVAIECGQLVLVVEDHPVNQQVIQQQMRLLGYLCEIAENGREGFAAWQSGDYALIFTDIHMPIMDGYELVSAIREQEQKEGMDRTPVIALTANALSGEALKCKEAGMDDYLSKPVELQTMKGMITRYLPERRVTGKTKGALQAPEQAAEAGSGQPGDERLYDLSEMIDLFGDKESVYPMVSGFIESTRQDIDALGAAFGQPDKYRIGEIAHRLKSALKAIGSREVARTADHIETMAGSGNDLQAETLTAFTSDLEAIIGDLQAEFAEEAVPRSS